MNDRSDQSYNDNQFVEVVGTIDLSELDEIVHQVMSDDLTLPFSSFLLARSSVGAPLGRPGLPSGRLVFHLHFRAFRSCGGGRLSCVHRCGRTHQRREALVIAQALCPPYFIWIRNVFF